ncbi:hypothetical protein MHUMG1_00001 [Metarhizium humberi]|uniref:Apple domain-containing protein n=1 Tax=Metarhizium humberi TaxID=2596975 RepID=A0A9P8MIU5_9HYPO|nr:hypothetical protein MHUMG1_00001 [Metarhizium humberi]
MQLLFSTAILVLAILQAALPAKAQQIFQPNHPACKLPGNFVGAACPGGIIDQILTGASTIERCSERCRQNPNCKSYAVVQAQNGGCWLYGGNATVCTGPLFLPNPGWFFDVDCYMCPAPPPCPNPPPPAARPCPAGHTPGCNCVCLTREQGAAQGLSNAPCQDPKRVGCACGQIQQGLWGFCAR